MEKALDLDRLIDKWPSILVARSELGRFTGGLISPGHMANLDSQGLGIPTRIRIGRKIAYNTSDVVDFLKQRVRELQEEKIR